MYGILRLHEKVQREARIREGRAAPTGGAARDPFRRRPRPARGEVTIVVDRDALLATLELPSRRAGPPVRRAVGSDVHRLARGGTRGSGSPTTCCRWSTGTGVRGQGRAARTPSRRTSPRSTVAFPTADWLEREVFDFFGVVFDGHPDLRRIEMPEDWEGHPLRKDHAAGRREHARTRARSSRPATGPSGGRDVQWRSRSPRDRPEAEETMIINMGPQHPRPTGCSGWSSSWTASTSWRAGRSSATCTPASRRTPSTAPGSRASRS